MTLDEARRHAAGLFAELRSPAASSLVEVGRREGEGLGFLEQLNAMTPPGFPFPELLAFGFTQLLNVPTYGPGEKLLWGVRFRFKGVDFAFEYRKFGLRLLCDPGQLDSPVVREVL